MQKMKRLREQNSKRDKAGKRRRKIQNRWFAWRGRRKVHRQIKDRLFRFLFEKDKEALLQLYNALNDTTYEDSSELEVVTIESAVYVVMKNDIAFVIAGTLNLYEHQSNINPNMPVRFLIYLAEEYQKLVEQAEESLYGTKQILLPAPQCVVFYNGEGGAPEEQMLRLSDAFDNKKSDIELKVRMLNINYGHNKELMEKCNVLGEYAQFVDITRYYIARGEKPQEALDTAIHYCIDHDILAGFLSKYRAEVLGMLLEEFDVDKYERSIKAEGIEIGIQQGMKQGTEYGRQLERERLNKLTGILLEQRRMDDLKRSIAEREYQEKLFREFHL